MMDVVKVEVIRGSLITRWLTGIHMLGYVTGEKLSKKMSTARSELYKKQTAWTVVLSPNEESKVLAHSLTTLS